jgi:hypothetical protein
VSCGALCRKVVSAFLQRISFSQNHIETISIATAQPPRRSTELE